MCGIAGILHHSVDEPVSDDVLRTMTDLMRHRGPDSEGFYREEQIGLGMRRLSIIDLQTGDQPVSNETGRVWAVLNGEIYNYRELQRDLRARGHELRSGSDTEVIVHLYEDHGAEFVSRLRGMFAIALWDADRRELLLARDRFGIKPLFIAESAGRMAFASEMKSLFPLGWPDLSWRPEALRAYLRLGYIPRPMTPYAGIRKMEQGSVETWRLAGTGSGPHVTAGTYWLPSMEPRRPAPTFAAACNEAIDLLADSVKLHLRSDVPLGAFLSGGVDSSTVVAFMRLCGVTDLKTFSIGFESDQASELPYAAQVARHLETEHYEQVVTAADASLLPELLAGFDEPFADSSVIPTYFVSRLARGEVTVTLSGDGGDELFAGYDAHRRLRAHHAIDALPDALRSSLFSGIGGVWPRSAVGGGFVRRMSEPSSLRHLTLTYGESHGDELLSEPFRDFLREAPGDPWLEEFRDDGTVSGAQLIDQRTYLADDILAKVDRTSMAVSLEARVPLLDHVFAEFVNGLPEEYKLCGGRGKVLLRAIAAPQLPPGLFERPKQGFAVPLREWLSGPLRATVEQRLFDAGDLFDHAGVARLLEESRSSGRDQTPWVWSLFSLATWADVATSSVPW